MGANSRLGAYSNKYGNCVLAYEALLITSDARFSLFELFIRPGGGALGYFFFFFLPPGTPNWHPLLKIISSKINTPFQKWANFLYPVLEFALKLILRSRNTLAPKYARPAR